MTDHVKVDASNYVKWFKNLYHFKKDIEAFISIKSFGRFKMILNFKKYKTQHEINGLVKNQCAVIKNKQIHEYYKFIYRNF